MAEISYKGREQILQRIIYELNRVQDGSVDDVEVNGISVVDLERVAHVTVPTKMSDLTPDIIHFATEAEWNAQPSLVGQAGHFYVYTDHDEVDGHYIPAIKIGDGNAYLINNPFIDSNVSTVLEHISDTIVHITQQEREFWNNKMRCYVQNQTEILSFTTN